MAANKHKNLSRLDTARVRPRSVPEEQSSAVVELGDMGEHIEKLKHVSSVTKKLADLLGGQLQGLSGTIPVLRGFEIVKDLRKRSKECHDGMKDAFEPLRAHIEREKALFYTKNAEAIKKIIQERVVEGVKNRLPVMLKEQVRRYQEHLKTNNILTDKINQVMVVTSARDANSVLSPNRPDEVVTLISPHPDWNGLTLGNLKNISGLAAARLVRDQGLTPSEGPPDSEQARISNLNMILKHLGVQYQAIPSWNGILLTSVTRKTNH